MSSRVPVIETQDLTRYYGAVRGIEALALQVFPGEIFGFLGPNGAGKTTTIRLFLDLLRPTRGWARIFGLEVRRHSREVRHRVGNLPGEVALYDPLKGRELLELLGSFRGPGGTRRMRELAVRLEMDLSRPVRAYSRGMKQKLAVIQALMHDPELLVLDEPTLGLDPLMQRELHALLQEEQARGKTVFLSSHSLPEVEQLCDRVGIVREGNLVAVEEVAALRARRVRKMELTLRSPVRDEELHIPGVELLRRNGNSLEFAVWGDLQAVLKGVAALPVEDIVFPPAALEDIFLDFYRQGKVETKG
ncbi:MAG: ABC transporter ATP-binding protein [Chloroflexi bacterium]|nr:ABC transporter ATP-binding protein [Chloroflexota bacterium]